MSWKMRPKTTCSFQRADEPLGDAVGLRLADEGKLGVIPKNRSWFWKCSDMNGLPWS
jgi:hypothetical protein